MRLATKVFPAPCWAFDTNCKLSAALAAQIARTPFPAPAPGTAAGQIARVAIRYVFFGPARPGDIDADEAAGIWTADMGLMLVQHPRTPKYNALSESTGAADAEWAIKNAIAAGYDPSQIDTTAGPPPLTLDMEGVQNPGPGPQAHAVRWTSDVRSAGYAPWVYFGFQWGFGDFAALGDFFAWCDFGNMADRPALPYALRQGLQFKHCGIDIDGDKVISQIVAVVRDVDIEETDPGLPHIDTPDTKAPPAQP